MTAQGDWNADFLFIRSYGSGNQDVFAIQCAAAPSEWGDVSGDDVLKYDYAFLRTNRKSKIGSLGITNGPPPDQLMLVGYADNHSDGRKLLRLEANIIATESNKIGSMDNPLGSGSSGSPWLGLMTVYSVSSHYRTDEKGIMWGPRLTANTMQLIEYTREGC